MLTKISWRSFFKQSKDYGVYLICMMLAVMVYYSFAAMTHDQPLLQRGEPDIQIASILRSGNLLMLIILISFMLSANRFFVIKRYREIGLYQLFGLRKRRIILLFVMENFLLNIVSFLGGISLGVIFSKFFAMILIKAMDLNIQSKFFISVSAVLTTLVVFMGGFLIIAGQNAWLIHRHQVIELFEVKTKKTLRRMPATKWTHLFGVLGAIFLVAGYWLACFAPQYITQIIIAKDFSVIFWYPLLIVFLCVVGTILFFRFTIKGLLASLKSLKTRSLQHLRFYAYGMSRFQVLNNWRQMVYSTLTTAAAIAILAGVISAISINTQSLQNSNPTDFQVAKEEIPKLQATLQNEGGRIKETTLLSFKATVMHITRQLLGDAESQVELYDLLKESEYQKFRQQYPKLPEISLDQPKQGVIFNTSDSFFEHATIPKRQVTLPAVGKMSILKLYPDYLGDRNLRYGSGVLVVTDELFEKIPGKTYQVAMVTAKLPENETWLAQIDQNIPEKWGHEIYYTSNYQKGNLQGQFSFNKGDFAKNTQEKLQSYSRLNIVNRQLVMRINRRQAGLIVYVAVFIGVTVTITTAGTMMLRQFFQIQEEQQNFQLLKKLGLTKKAMRRLVYRQLAWIFMPAVLVMACHAGFAIHFWAQFIHSNSYWLAYSFAAGMICFYLIAYWICAHFYIRAMESS